MKNKLVFFAFLGIGAAALAAWLLMTKSKTATPTATSSSQAGFSATDSKPAEAEADILVAGKIEIEQSSLGMARQIPTLFVILRDEGSRAPYAVAKIPSQLEGNSLKFQLTRSDVMMQGQPTPATPSLKVRFDSDGNPMTENPHDVVGTAKGFQIGARDLIVEARLAQAQVTP